MLDDGPSSHLQLESAVKSIASKLTETTADELGAAAQNLRELREEKLRQLADCENRLIAAHRGEYEDLVVGGEVQSPLGAARRLREWQGTHNWIPGSVSLGQVCSLSNEELEELYALQVSLPLEDEQLLDGDLPNASSSLRSWSCSAEGRNSSKRPPSLLARSSGLDLALI